jgi:hypothetical protein
MTEAKKIKNSFLYMFNGEPIADFLKECEISIVKTKRSIKIPTFAITFRVPAPTYKKYEHHHDFFQGKLKQGLHQFHQYDSVLVFLTADWDRLEMISTEVKPVLTPWQEVNAMQDTLLSQVHTASETITFQNVWQYSQAFTSKVGRL